jgi:carboxyl-terminal processing protease
MKIKKIVFGLLILTLLSCNYVTQMVLPPTATPFPTATLTATATAVPPTPTPVPLVPAYVPPQCANVPLATVAPDAIAQATQPVEERNPEIFTNEQLSVFTDVIHVIETVYVYPDFNGKDWEEIKARYRARIEAGLDTETFYGEMWNMIQELEDEHSSFLSPRDVQFSQDELEGEAQFVGIGVLADFDSERQRIIVRSIYPNSAAEHAGIKPHDTLLTADNLPVLEDDLNRVRGPECSAVVLTVQSPGEAPRQVMLIRYTIEGNLKMDTRLIPTTDGSKIGYILIPSFYDISLPEQIEEALNNFGVLDGLILDVRNNGGGTSIVANPIMSYFTAGRLGRFVSREDSWTLRVQANPIHNSQTVPMVVIVDEGTVSYGEIFAGIMRDSRNAKITGQTSLGNVEVLNIFSFEDGSQMWLAAETFYPQHSDENWEESGIVPDLEAYAEWDTFTFETDPSIAAALTLLGHK